MSTFVLHRHRWLLLTGMSLLWWSNLTGAEDMIEVSSQPDIDQGREIYQTHCLECHRASGQGDGGQATTLMPPPGNLVSEAIAMKTDDELFTVITEGMPGTPMPGWKDQLSLDDRRNVLAYIRSLAFP